MRKKVCWYLTPKGINQVTKRPSAERIAGLNTHTLIIGSILVSLKYLKTTESRTTKKGQGRRWDF